MSASNPDPLQDRLESLEKTVANLARDLRALRAVVDRLDEQRNGALHPLEADIPPAVPAADIPAAVPAVIQQRVAAPRPLASDRRSLDLEAVIGRYGTLALASLTILLGAGAFLSWAIAHGKIGPNWDVDSMKIAARWWFA